MLVNVVKKIRKYKNKKGEEKEESCFYLEINGNLVRFLPYYFEKTDEKGNVIFSFNTYKEINLVATLIEEESK